MRASSSAKQTSISRSASGPSTSISIPTSSKGSAASGSSNGIGGLLSSIGLYESALEVRAHVRVLVARRSSERGDAPDSLAAEPAVLRLRDAHERLLRHRV